MDGLWSLDYKQFYLNLDKANTKHTMDGLWSLEYTARDYFGLESMSAAAWASAGTSWRPLTGKTTRRSRSFQRLIMCKIWRPAQEAAKFCRLFAVTTARHTACLAEFGFQTTAQLDAARAAEDARLVQSGHTLVQTHSPGEEDDEEQQEARLV